MSTFEVKVRPVSIQAHDNADSLEIAQVFGYQSIVLKGQFKTGDLAIYLPEASVLPDKLIEHIGLTGKLAGPQHNRIKAVRLRGVLSQGITIKQDGLSELYGEPTPLFEEGADWKEYLGITKYIPEVPIHMSGEVFAVDNPFFNSYTDIENIKRFPTVFTEGEEIYATEKLHGTCFQGSLLWNDEKQIYEWFITSKGHAQNHFSLKESDSNVYWKASKLYDLESKARLIAEKMFNNQIHEVSLFGEVLGVQDLKYGFSSREIGFRLFDIRCNNHYMDYVKFMKYADLMKVETVPFLYKGNSISECLKLTSGKTALFSTSDQAHIREGIVIKPVIEQYVLDLGRKIIKSISEHYLLRGGNATEME